MKGVLLTTLLLLGVLVTAAQAQRDTTARIVGIASSAFNGNPLSGVMIAVPGARRFARTGCVPTRLSHGTVCSVSVWVDGNPFWDEDYDQIPVDEVAGVEAYGDNLVGFDGPGWYRGGPGLLHGPITASLDRSSMLWGCGSIQIWTR